MHMRLFLFCLFLVFIAEKRVFAQEEKLQSTEVVPLIEETKIDSIIEFGKTFLGKPYRYKGPSPWPMDCSGFLAYIFGEHGITLSRSSSMIGKEVETIPFEEIQKGDFMFFKGRDLNSSSIGHVSLVIEVKDDSLQLLHSCSRGIIIENYYLSTYYTSRFLKCGRIR